MLVAACGGVRTINIRCNNLALPASQEKEIDEDCLTAV